MATKQANGYKEKGNAAFKAGDHAKAIEFYTYATELDPNNPIFFTNRSTAYFKMKKFDKSLRDANKAIAKDKAWAKGHYRRGIVLMEKEQFKEALVSLEQSAKLKPDNSSFSIAVQTCKQKMTKGMSSAEITKLEANEFFKCGKIEDALKKYTLALKLCGNSEKEKLVKADIYGNRAACYRQLYDSKAVVSDCTEALKLNPNHVKALIRRGQALESLEKFQEALQDFKQANYLAPGTPIAVQGSSRIRASLKRMKKLGC